jgi:hypothetical protein
LVSSVMPLAPAIAVIATVSFHNIPTTNTGRVSVLEQFPWCDVF